jgi:copper chaperone
MYERGAREAIRQIATKSPICYFVESFCWYIASNRERKGITMTQKEIVIEGMNCGHCVMAVKKELSKIAGLIIEDVQIGKAKVQFDEAKVTFATIEKAIDEAGFKMIAVN